MRDPRDSLLISDAAAIRVHPNFTFAGGGVANRPQFDVALVEMKEGLEEYTDRVRHSALLPYLDALG